MKAKENTPTKVIGRKIGEGSNSEVFEYGENGRVIKLAKSNIDGAALRREFNNALVAWKLGLPVARPYEMVEIDNRPGVVFEWIHGESLMDRLFQGIAANNVSNEHNDVRLIAGYLSKVHRLFDESLLEQNEHLKWQINNTIHLNDEEKARIIEKLDRLPAKNQICHGDPNPNNFLMQDGELIMIDWMDATIGNPEADLAEFILMVKFAILPPGTPKEISAAFELMREQIVDVFMDEYTSLTGITYDEVDPWIVPIAARKLHADGISEAEKQLLLKEIRERL